MRQAGVQRTTHRLLAKLSAASLTALVLVSVALPVAAAGDGIVSLPQDRISAPDDGSMTGVVVIVSG